MKTKQLHLIPATVLALSFGVTGYTSAEKTTTTETSAAAEIPEYFQLRPEVEKAYGYSHAVRIGNELKISGAVSMDSVGNLTAPGDLRQQADLDQILQHYEYTAAADRMEDVVVENILTTDMQKFEAEAGFRNEIYQKQFPTGSWFGVKELALLGQLIEIELEAYKAK